MSYTVGEVLAAAQVTAVTGFSSSNVTRGEWGILNSGKSDHYAILKRGETNFVWEGRSNTENYRTIIEVWQRVKDDQASYDLLNGYVDTIKARLDSYRKLADTTGTLRDANLVGTGVITEQWRNNADGPAWLKIELYLDWTEESYVNFAE